MTMYGFILKEVLHPLFPDQISVPVTSPNPSSSASVLCVRKRLHSLQFFLKVLL